MPRRKTRSLLLIQAGVALTMAAAVGCFSQGDRPSLTQVRGTVTLNGQPLAGVVVSFQPVAKGRSSSGVTDKEGRYQLTYLRDIEGARLGQHKVQIATAFVATSEEPLPSRYNQKTTLTVEVEADKREYDFDLVTP